ncbi:MAG: response regulator [Nitrososphaeraceae archaeon]
MPTMSKSKSILLVDDEPDIVNLFTDLLNKEDYDVISFTNPLKALEHYKKNFARYGLVIADILMPGMSGFDLLKDIKKIDATISFFLMSANDTINFSEIEGIKIDGFIQKPVRIKEFLSILEKHFISIQIS